MNKDELYQLFREPTAAYRGKPFWSWNGKLQKDELIRQLHVLKQMGFGGTFMHSRTGLATEYLGDEWFDLINACTDESKKLGMEAWLYDEDRWPSGTAGGKVTEHHAYRMSYLNLEIVKAAKFTWTADVYKAFSCLRDGFDLLAYREIHRQTAAEKAAEGDIFVTQKSDLDTEANKFNDLAENKFNETDESKPRNTDDLSKHDHSQHLDEVMVFRIVHMQESSFYNGNTYVDTMNREATDYYIKLTHQQYKKRCGHHLGKTIKGIFTDEPHRGQLMSSFGSSGGDTGLHPEWSVPWTKRLPEHFKDHYGYYLESRLPELFLFWQREKVSQVKWHFTDLLQTLFINHYFKPIQDWCQANQMTLTGHVLQEDTLTGQTAVAGSVMRYYEHMDYPGVDVLSEWNNHYWLVKQLSSVSRQTGKTWLLSELYGCTGWQFDFKGHKHVGDWQALLGINLRCPHLSWYTMEGEAKRDYPASILDQSGWWDQYTYVEDYFSRFNVLMTRGRPVCNTLVVYPIESVWCQVYPGWCDGLDAKDTQIRAMEKQLKDLFYWLMGSHIDFDYGDEDILSRLGCVKETENGQYQLVVGEATYDQVIVANLLTMRSSTLKLLQLFSGKGGKVIFSGPVPEYVDAVKSNDVKHFITSGEFFEQDSQPASEHTPQLIPFNKEAVTAACSDTDCQWINLTSADSDDAEKIWVQMREDGSDLLIFMLNLDRDQAVSHLCLSIDYTGVVEEWDCASGDRYLLSDYNASHLLELSFAAGEEKILLVSRQSANLSKKKDYTELGTFKFKGPYPYTLDEPNICVLDIAQYKLHDGDWYPEEEILRVDRKIRDHYNLPYRSGSMLQPWFQSTLKTKPVGSVTLRYQFEMKTLFDDLFLVIENPQEFDVLINGERYNLSEYYESDQRWIDHCFKVHRLPIHLLKIGMNAIELCMNFSQTVNLEAIYLLGSFAVSLDHTRKILDKLPEYIEAGDLTTQGFPFYSGSVTYHMNLNELKKKDSELRKKNTGVLTEYSDGIKNLLESKSSIKLISGIKLTRLNGACVKAEYEINSKTYEKMIAWPPFAVYLNDVKNSDAKNVPDHLDLKLFLTRRNTFGPLHQVPVTAHSYGPDNFTQNGDHFSKAYMLVPSGIPDCPEYSFYVET